MMSWILVANASKACIYSAPKAKLFNSNNGSLKLISSFSHPESRKKTLDLTSDKLGNFQGSNASSGSFIEASNPKQYEADRFAKELAQELEKGRNQHQFDDLILVAEPHFHGMLNKNISQQLSNLVSLDIGVPRRRGRRILLCHAVLMMREGPSISPIRRRYQTTLSCIC